MPPRFHSILPYRSFSKHLLCLLVAGLACHVDAAAYATGGTGKYLNKIMWLTWGSTTDSNGKAGQSLANGSSTSATIPIGDKKLIVTCSLSNITGTGGVKSYAPGTFVADGLDNLYNIGGISNNNKLVNGIIGSNSGTLYNFHIKCVGTLDEKPFDIPGLVVSDAESLTNNEYFTVAADGNWQVMERLTCGTYPYNATLSTDSKTITFKTTNPGDCNLMNESGSASNAVAVAFLAFNSTAYTSTDRQVNFDVTIKGNGLTAVAIGLLAPYLDSGDAPATYGQAIHLFPPTLTADGLSPGTTANVSAAGFTISTLSDTPTTNKLGNKEDADGTGLTGNVTATTDDVTGINDEDAVNSSLLPQLNVKSTNTYTVPVVCSGIGTVKGWLDFNINGQFEDSESAQASCTGNSATVNLQFAIPNNIKSGQSYLRVRYALDATQLALPSGIATTGEAEDYAVPIYAQMFLKKTWDKSVSGDTITLDISGGTLTSDQTKEVTAPNTDSTSAFVLGGTTVKVSETGTKVAFYAPTLNCTKVSDNSSVYSGSTASASFTMPVDSNVNCLYQNKLRMPLIPQMRKYVRKLPSGVFAKIGQAIPGTTLQYCITFQNTGDGPASNFKLMDAFPTAIVAAYPMATTDSAKWNLQYSAAGTDLADAAAAPTASTLPSGASLSVGTVDGKPGIILDLGAAGLASQKTGTVCFDGTVP